MFARDADAKRLSLAARASTHFRVRSGTPSPVDRERDGREARRPSARPRNESPRDRSSEVQSGDREVGVFRFPRGSVCGEREPVVGRGFDAVASERAMNREEYGGRVVEIRGKAPHEIAARIFRTPAARESPSGGSSAHARPRRGADRALPCRSGTCPSFMTRLAAAGKPSGYPFRINSRASFQKNSRSASSVSGRIMRGSS